MKRLILGLALAALSGSAQQERGEIAPIALYTQFQHQPSVAIKAAVKDELEAIMSPSGLHFEWRSLPQTNASEVSVELAVVSFKGHCDISGLSSVHGSPGALGWTHVSDGIILPFSDVDCDRIRVFVQHDLLSLPAEQRERVFSRAVARVLAHELYHVLANTSRHGSCGVGKSAYTVHELLSDDFQFEEHESDALRANRPHTLSAEPAGSSI